MANGDLVEVLREAVIAAAIACGPVLAAGFVVSLFAGIMQAATGVQEPLVAMLPKLTVMGCVLLATLPWMLEQFTSLFRAMAAGP